MDVGFNKGSVCPKALIIYPGVPPDSEKITDAFEEPKQLTLVILSITCIALGAIKSTVSLKIQLLLSIIITEYCPELIFCKL